MSPDDRQPGVTLHFASGPLWCFAITLSSAYGIAGTPWSLPLPLLTSPRSKTVFMWCSPLNFSPLVPPVYVCWASRLAARNYDCRIARCFKSMLGLERTILPYTRKGPSKGWEFSPRKLSKVGINHLPFTVSQTNTLNSRVHEEYLWSLERKKICLITAVATTPCFTSGARLGWLPAWLTSQCSLNRPGNSGSSGHVLS